MKIKKLFITSIIVLFFLNCCATVKEGLTGSKRSKSADEFFVQKKSPLVLPPDFEDLPTPNPQKETNEIDDNNIQDLLGIYEDQVQTSQGEGDDSVESSILEKINNN